MLNQWSTRQIDFVLAYPQADTECDLYVRLPNGFETSSGNSKSHVLLLKRNLHGQRQGSKIWNDHLVLGLKKIGFEPSKIDESVFYKGQTMFFCYVDDGVFLGPDDDEIDKAINDLKKLKHDLEEIGDIEDYVGVNFERKEDGCVKLTQPYLMQQIIDEVKT